MRSKISLLFLFFCSFLMLHCGIGAVSLEKNELGGEHIALEQTAFAFVQEFAGYSRGGKKCTLTSGDGSGSPCRGEMTCGTDADCERRCKPPSSGVCEYSGTEELYDNCKKKMPSCYSANNCKSTCATVTLDGWSCKKPERNDTWACKSFAPGLKKRSPRPLIVFLSGASFSPLEDPRFAEGSRLLEIRQKIVQNASLSITIADVDAIKEGETIEWVNPNLHPKQAKVTFYFRRGAKEIKADDDYPAQLNAFGSKVKMTVKITKKALDAGGYIEGEFLLSYEKDPKRAEQQKHMKILTGSLQGSFRALVVKEAIAACFHSDVNLPGVRMNGGFSCRISR